MIDALKRNLSIVRANNSSYGNFVYDDERYFFKLVDKDNFLKELNGYFEVNGKLNIKKLVNVFFEDDKYYLIYEYDKNIEKNRGLINDLFVNVEYNKSSYDKNIFFNIINSYRKRYRNLKLLSYSKNDIFFEGRIKSRLIDWFGDDNNFDKCVYINYKESVSTNDIIRETINYFNKLDNKLCLLSGGDPNTLNLSVEGTFFDLVTAGYNNIYGEVAIMYISHLIHDAYFGPKYNKNSYTNHELIYNYINKFKPKLKYKNNNIIYINSNIVTSSIRKKYVRDYLNMLKEENIPIDKDIRYYLVMRILCVFDIRKNSKIYYYYSLYLLHFIYNFIGDNAIDSLIELLDYMDEI